MFLLRKSDALRTSILYIQKVHLQDNFWGAPSQADIMKFSNFLLQLKNMRSTGKTVCGVSIDVILEGIMMF